jgi:hypothetical protein
MKLEGDSERSEEPSLASSPTSSRFAGLCRSKAEGNLTLLVGQ